MYREILLQAWLALRRNPLRSFLTMLGIVWGIVAVALLIAYGSSFRGVLLDGFQSFGRSAVIAWPGTTSEQAGGERAGKRIRFEKADMEALLEEATLVKQVSLETVRWRSLTYGARLENTAVRGVYPIYGEIRNQVPGRGRWISHDDLRERRRVVVLGALLYKELFSRRPAVDETIKIAGMRFTVIGVMDRKMNFSSYFTHDDNSAFIPYTTAGDLWNNRFASVLVFAPVAPQFEARAMEQVRGIIARRQRFSPTDKRAVQMFGREQFRPIIDGITIGLQVLLLFIGALTLGIGGVGVMNILLVSVRERTREIGLRRALGARRRHIRLQFLAEALLLTLLGGALGLVLAQVLAAGIGTLPLLGPAFEDESGKRDIHLAISFNTVALSTGVLVLVGVLSGLMPAMRAARLEPVEALRYE